MFLTVRLLPFAVLSCLPLIGCSSNDAATNSPSGGSGGAPGDSGQSGAGGSAGASAAKAGFIGVTSHATELATVFVNSVSADFFDGPGYSYGKGCQREVVGKCQVLICDFTNGGAQAPPT